MSMLVNAGKRWLARFGQHKIKTLKNYLKSKATSEPLKYSEDMEQEEKTIVDNSHRLIYAIYVPSLLLAVPTVYFLVNPAAPLFLQSVNLLQYYASGVLFFNSFFTIKKQKYYIPFLVGVAGVNVITGPYSVISPLILGALNFYFPFTDEQMHKTENQTQAQKLKHYMNVQACFYFLITFITTLKCYHFFSIKQLQKKLEGYQKENQAYYEGIISGRTTVSE